MKKRILIVVGTRPNFIKVTRFKKVAELYPDMEVKIVHTGQHYDYRMADVFFSQFNLIPDYFLDIPQASANTQMAEIMIKLEKLTNVYKPHLLLVPGDVNSTLAAAITANKTGIKMAHIESGLRSFDRTMPEEFNRILTDELSNYFFVTEQSGIDNLLKEGKRKDAIFFVGNTMIDTLVAFENEIQASSILQKLQLNEEKFVLMTIHRPATVDNKKEFKKLIGLIDILTEKYKIIFPVHPRTLRKAEEFLLINKLKNNNKLILVDPLDYFSFQKLVVSCAFILTDSGGIQEESTFRKVPCLTLRANTERPSTVGLGTNTLIPFDTDIIMKQIKKIENNTYKKGVIPPCWDGKSTERMMKIIFKKILQ